MNRKCIRKTQTLIKTANIRNQIKINNFRENRSYGKEIRLESIKKFYDSTRYKPKFSYENIDSHDNSLYHKTLTNKDSKIHHNINNYDYSINH